MEKQYHLESIHDGLFAILKEIDALCQRHEIEYFLDGGTLLGTIRGQDFIPWDDDADINMTRDNFERFCKVAHELPEPLRFVMPNEFGGYFFDFVPRVINTEFPLRRETEEDRAQNNYQNRLSVDIFLLDSAPDDSKEFGRLVFRQKKLYGYAMAHRFNKHAHSHGFVNRMKIAVLTTIGRFHSLDSIFEKQKTLATSYRDKQTGKYCISNTILKEIHLSYSKEWFAGTVRMPLRDITLSCPVGYHEILTHLFGDYMTPPPEDERHPMHVEE